MLVAGPGLPPKGYVYLLTREVRSSDAGAVVATNLEQSLSVIVHAAYALAAYASGPYLPDCPNASVEVA